jgi:hypothetical protein
VNEWNILCYEFNPNIPTIDPPYKHFLLCLVFSKTLRTPLIAFGTGCQWRCPVEITVIFYSFALSQLLQRAIHYYPFNLDLTNLPLLFLFFFFSFGMDLHCSWVVLVHGVLMIFQLSRRLPGDLFVLVLYTFLWSGSWVFQTFA